MVQKRTLAMNYDVSAPVYLVDPTGVEILFSEHR